MPLQERAIRLMQGARLAIEQLRAEHGPLLFIESHGCCDNRAPICLPVADFMVGSSDVQVAEVAGCPYYVDARTLAHQPPVRAVTEFELDVEPGYADGMSLAPPGHHFVLHARITVLPGRWSDPRRGKGSEDEREGNFGEEQ